MSLSPAINVPLVPRKYQEEAIQLGLKNNLLLLDEPGTGKTLMAVEIIRRLRETREFWYDRPILILAPKQTASFWRDTILRQAPNDTGTIYIAGPSGANIPPARQIGSKDWIIAHYETVLIRKDWASIRWAVIVCDEAHRIKNRKAKRVMALKDLRATRVIALTGTPMEKSAGDMWSILNWLYPSDWRSYWGFYSKYVEEEFNKYTGFRRIKGSKNVEELTERIKPFTLRRRKVDVAPELPPRPELQRVPVELEPSQRSVYNQIRKAMLEDSIKDRDGTEIQLWIKNVVSRIIRLQQATTDPALLGFTCPSAKLDWLYDFLEDNPEEVCVVFTRFRDTAIRIHKHEPGSLLIVGGTVFQGWTSGRLCVGTIAAMAEGINLQRATTAIFLDQEWSTIKMSQAIDRIHRIDDLRPKSAYCVMAESTVDSLVSKALERKWSDIELVNTFLGGRDA